LLRLGLRILVLSPRQCFPPQTGAKLREYYLIRSLSERADVTHVSFDDPGGRLSAGDLPFCSAVISLPRPRGYTAGKVLRGLFGRWPLPIVNYSANAMQAVLAGLLAKERFDLIHLDSIHMAVYEPQLRRATGAPVVYDWHNIESEMMFRYGRHTPSFLRARYAALTAKRLSNLEDQILRTSLGHLVCSEREREELQRRVPEARITVVENGVDAKYFDGAAGGNSKHHRIVFVGAMSYHANAEAAIYFARQVWPEIHRQFPGWTLSIVGSNPTVEVLALHGRDNVEVTGTVADVRPYYGDAAAAVVPLRVGGGTRLKILEAMAAGVPVISTALGAEGLAVSPGKDILIANREEEWRTHLESLAGDAGRWDALSRAGRELVHSRYDWETLARALYDTYAEWLASPRKLAS